MITDTSGKVFATCRVATSPFSSGMAISINTICADVPRSGAGLHVLKVVLRQGHGAGGCRWAYCTGELIGGATSSQEFASCAGLGRAHYFCVLFLVDSPL